MVHPIFYLFASILVAELCSFAGAQGIGVTYYDTREVSQFPPERKSVELLKSHNIQRIYLYKPDHPLLHYLRKTGIEVLLGVPNDDIQSIAYSPKFAKVWVKTNVVWHAPFINFRAIVVGDSWNENLTSHLLPAMLSLQQTISFFNLSIPVSVTMLYNAVLTPNPPSSGYFENSLLEIMSPILDFLYNHKYPLVYPVEDFHQYTSSGDFHDASLAFALLNKTEPEIHDGVYAYTNILDVLVDSVYIAIEKIGIPDVEIIVIGTGWPVSLDFQSYYNTVENAQTHNNNLIRRLRSNIGTPRRAGRPVECYINKLYRNDSVYGTWMSDRFGLFYPNNLTLFYPLDFWYVPPK